MKIKELQSKSENELQKLLLAKRETLRAIRFKVAQRQLKKIHDIKITKKDIARILTLLRAKQKESSKKETNK